LKRPTARLAALTLAVAAAFAAMSGTAAAKTCGQQVIDDWYGSKTGQLHKIYPLHCYKAALAIVGKEQDLEIYSNARDDILRAMAIALASGHNGPQGPATSIITADALPSFLGGPDAKNGGRPPTSVLPYQRPKPSAPFHIPRSSSASSVPVPAIVLGAIAALLLALGSAAYLARRRQLRRQNFRPRHANGRNPS